EISEVRMRKVPITGKAPLRRWPVPTPRLTSNRKRILRGKSGAGRPLPRLVPSRLRRRLHATSSNGSLEYDGNPRPHRRHRRPTADVEYDELSTRDFPAERIGNSTSGRSTSSIL